MKRTRKRKRIKKPVTRKTGYYWVQINNKNWIICKWWESLQFFDSMSLIPEKGFRDKITKVNENQIIYDKAN